MAKPDEAAVATGAVEADQEQEEPEGKPERPVRKKPKQGDFVTVSMKDLVAGEDSLAELSAIEITGKISYFIAKWLRKIRPELELFRNELTAIMKKHDAKPGKRPGSLVLDVDSESFKVAQEELEDFQDDVLKEEIYFQNVKVIPLDELMAALPVPKPSDEDEEPEKGRIKPYILADLEFMFSGE